MLRTISLMKYKQFTFRALDRQLMFKINSGVISVTEQSWAVSNLTIKLWIARGGGDIFCLVKWRTLLYGNM